MGDSPFVEGFFACVAGKSLKANPYSYTSRKWEMWSEGWHYCLGDFIV